MTFPISVGDSIETSAQPAMLG